MSEFGLFGKLVAREGKRDELAQVLVDASHVLQQTPGCKSYVVALADDEPNAIYVFEAWDNPQAHADSLQRDDVRPLLQRGLPLVEQVAEQIKLGIVAGTAGR